MQKISLIIIFIGIAFSGFAQDRMTVHLKDGSKVSYEMNKVDYVEMENVSKTGDTIPDIGGTVAEAVDLGLSVKWASHNIGASSLSETGKCYSWDEAQSFAHQWGTGWRLPTDQEWKELYESCSWIWTVVDGIGGRCIKGKNGSTIFFPASGFNIDGKSHVIGNIGTYWTSEPSQTESLNAVGTYFDSGNIYRIEFPKTNGFTVRLVKD